MYLGICRPTEVTQDDGFGDGFWVQGARWRQEGGYWNRVVALTIRPTYDSPTSLPPSLPPFLSLPQWRNRDREPPCHVGLGQFREELPNCLQLLHKRTMSKERRNWKENGAWSIKGGFSRLDLSRVKFKFRSFFECELFRMFGSLFFSSSSFYRIWFFRKWTNGMNVIRKTMGWKTVNWTYFECFKFGSLWYFCIILINPFMTNSR